MDSKMESLHIDLPKPAIKKEAVVDSWEDEDLGDDAETPTELVLKHVASDGPGTHPPPPTPISPNMKGNYDWSAAQVLGGGRPQPIDSGRSTPRSDNDAERRRPEKTTATASRMIASSLGVKLPKKTDEQRQYDRAVREQEIKRKNNEKAAHEREIEEDEKAKAAMWDG